MEITPKFCETWRKVLAKYIDNLERRKLPTTNQFRWFMRVNNHIIDEFLKTKEGFVFR